MRSKILKDLRRNADYLILLRYYVKWILWYNHRRKDPMSMVIENEYFRDLPEILERIDRVKKNMRRLLDVLN